MKLLDAQLRNTFQIRGEGTRRVDPVSVRSLVARVVIPACGTGSEPVRDRAKERMIARGAMIEGTEAAGPAQMHAAQLGAGQYGCTAANNNA